MTPKVQFGLGYSSSGGVGGNEPTLHAVDSVSVFLRFLGTPGSSKNGTYSFKVLVKNVGSAISTRTGTVSYLNGAVTSLVISGVTTTIFGGQGSASISLNPPGLASEGGPYPTNPTLDDFKAGIHMTTSPGGVFGALWDLTAAHKPANAGRSGVTVKLESNGMGGLSTDYTYSHIALSPPSIQLTGAGDSPSVGVTWEAILVNNGTYNWPSGVGVAPIASAQYQPTINIYPPSIARPNTPDIPNGQNPNRGGTMPVGPAGGPDTGLGTGPGGGSSGNPPGVTTPPTTPVFGGGTYVWLEANPNPIIFDDTCVGSVKSFPFIVTNSGTASVTIPTTSNGSDPNFSVMGSEDVTLAAKGSVSGIAYFTPTAELTYNFDAEIVDEDGNALYNVILTGTGINCDEPDDPVIKTLALLGDLPNSGDVNFLEVPVGEAAGKTVTALNTGNVPVSVSSALFHSGDPQISVVSDSFLLGVGQSKGISVSFTPTAAEEYATLMKVGTNATNAQLDGYIYFAGYGVGITTPDPITRLLRFDGPLSFGGVQLGEYKDKAFTVTSVGNGSVLISSIEVPKPFYLTTNDNRFDNVTQSNGRKSISVKTVGDVLAPGQTTSPITVRFAPETAGEFAEAVTAAANVTAPPTTTPADGTGVFDTPPDDDTDPPDPDDDPPSDPSTAGESALDGVGDSCIRKTCEIPYLYNYEANK